MNDTDYLPICSANAVDLTNINADATDGAAHGGLKCIPAKSGALLIFDEDGVLYNGESVPCWRMGDPEDIYIRYISGQEDPPLEADEVQATYLAGGDIILLYLLPVLPAPVSV